MYRNIRLAGVLLALGNTLATLPGIVTPVLTGICVCMCVYVCMCVCVCV